MCDNIQDSFIWKKKLRTDEFAPATTISEQNLIVKNDIIEKKAVLSPFSKSNFPQRSLYLNKNNLFRLSNKKESESLFKKKAEIAPPVVTSNNYFNTSVPSFSLYRPLETKEENSHASNINVSSLKFEDYNEKIHYKKLGLEPTPERDIAFTMKIRSSSQPKELKKLILLINVPLVKLLGYVVVRVVMRGEISKKL